MKKFLINLVKGTLILGGALLSGCATPSFFKGNKSKGPIPEDTIIKRETIPYHAVTRERTIAAPMRPEPEEVLIIEPDVEVIEIESVAKPIGAEYVVQRGDCLCWLAKKYDVRFQDLLEANGFDKNTKLKVGQKIFLPGVTEEQLAQSKTSPTEYIVQRGDCLSKIAQKYGLKVREIKAANGMTNDRIVAGKKIIIPERGRYMNHRCAETQPVAKTARGEKAFVVDDKGYYAIQKGDTRSKIASRAKVSVSDLQNWNNLSDPAKIRVGQKIVVKRKVASEVVNTVKPVEAIPGITPTAVVQESMPVRRYDFVDDADFFGKVDEIPIIQVQD